MLSLFRALRSLVSASYVRKVSAEGSASLLVYHSTAVLLFAFCLLVSAIQYFGEPIQCVQDKKDEDAAINEHVMNSFCFVASTYTVASDALGFECSGKGKFNAYPGVGPDPVDRRTIRRHSYYIWVPFVLFFQALTFLIPYSYWAYCEGGLIRKLLNGVAGFDLQVYSEDGQGLLENIKSVSVYFQKRLRTHRMFTFAWLFYDVLAFGIVLANFFLTDELLGGRFRNYGIRAAAFPVDLEDCNRPAEDAFPKLTKCTFYKFGAGGSLQNFDSLCVMALNVVNEKIYVVLWFWFLLLVPFAFALSLLKIATLHWSAAFTDRRERESRTETYAKRRKGGRDHLHINKELCALPKFGVSPRTDPNVRTYR